jgi:guanyl-specific ribonuclease Sa
MHASKRGAKRIVFSNDGLIYYTDDHYESFTLLYGEE